MLGVMRDGAGTVDNCEFFLNYSKCGGDIWGEVKKKKRKGEVKSSWFHGFKRDLSFVPWLFMYQQSAYFQLRVHRSN